MQHRKRLMFLIVLIVAGLMLAACNKEEAKTHAKPAHTEAVDGSEYKRVILTEKAAERLDIQTDAIREEEVDGSPRQVMPYAALVYGLNGETWAYTNPEPLTYTRQPVSVDYIDQDLVVLLESPSSGTQVVTVGVSELYGVDTGVGK